MTSDKIFGYLFPLYFAGFGFGLFLTVVILAYKWVFTIISKFFKE